MELRHSPTRKAAEIARWAKLIHGYAREHADEPGWARIASTFDDDEIRLMIAEAQTYSIAFRLVEAACGAAVEVAA